MIYISIIFWTVATILDSVMDTLVHHYDSSIFAKYKNQQFWNPSISWLNKYTDHDVSKGIRKGLFVQNLSDAWHLFKSIKIICFAISIISFRQVVVFDIFVFDYFLTLIVYGILWNFVFNTFYNKILR